MRYPNGKRLFRPRPSFRSRPWGIHLERIVLPHLSIISLYDRDLRREIRRVLVQFGYQNGYRPSLPHTCTKRVFAEQGRSISFLKGEVVIVHKGLKATTSTCTFKSFGYDLVKLLPVISARFIETYVESLQSRESIIFLIFGSSRISSLQMSSLPTSF